MDIDDVELLVARLESAINNRILASKSDNKILLENVDECSHLDDQLRSTNLRMIQMQNAMAETVRYLDNVIFDINKILKC